MAKLLGISPRVALVCVITTLLASAASASAHTWNLEQDFASSPDGVTAAANPFGDSYGEAGTWAIGYGGGGTYSTATEPLYTGLTRFSLAPSSDWHGHNGFYFAGATEGWQDAAGYASQFPYIGNNTGESAAGWWPAETIFAHPAPDLEVEDPRPTVRWTSPITGTVSIAGTFATVDCGAAGNGVDYSVDEQAAGASTVTHLASGHVAACGAENSSATYSSGSLAVQKGDAYYFSLGDGGNNEYAFDSTAITLAITDGAPEPLSISAPARATAVYKHAIAPITVSGKDTDGDAVALSASNVPAGLSFNASTGVLSGSPTVNAGSYAVTFSARDGHGETVMARTRLTVEKALCHITNKPALFAMKSPAALKVKVTDGMTKAAVVGQSIGFTVANTWAREGVGTWFATTASTGVASVKAPLAAGEVYLAGASLEGSPDYQPCQTSASEIVTLAPATYVSAGAGTITTAAKESASFGYVTVKEGVGGNPFVLITPAGELSAPNITSISKPSATTATWSGYGGWNGENAEYTATASDPSTGADTLSVTVTVGGVTKWSSGTALAVKGGDLKVH